MVTEGDGWQECGWLDVCCDYGVCLNRMRDELGVEAPVEECAGWVSMHLIDAQDAIECEGCRFE